MRHYLAGAHVWAFYPLTSFGEKGLMLLNYQGQEFNVFTFKQRGTNIVYKFTYEQIMNQAHRFRPFCIRSDLRGRSLEVVL